MSRPAKRTVQKVEKPTQPITLQEVAKIQSRYAKSHDGKVTKGCWVARLQKVAQRNADAASVNLLQEG